MVERKRQLETPQIMTDELEVQWVATEEHRPKRIYIIGNIHLSAFEPNLDSDQPFCVWLLPSEE